jgi:hypothetical protein
VREHIGQVRGTTRAEPQEFLRARTCDEISVLLESEPLGATDAVRVAVHAIDQDDASCRIGDLEPGLAAELGRAARAGHSIEVAWSEFVDGPGGRGVRLCIRVGETAQQRRSERLRALAKELAFWLATASVAWLLNLFF